MKKLQNAKAYYKKYCTQQHQKLFIFAFIAFSILGYFYFDSKSVRVKKALQETITTQKKTVEKNRKRPKKGLYKNGYLVPATLEQGTVAGVYVYEYTEITLAPGDTVEYYFGENSFETFAFDGFPTHSIQKINSKGKSFSYHSRQSSDYFGKVTFKSNKRTKMAIGTTI